MHLTTALLAALSGLGKAAVIWDGRFNDMTSAADLNKWSWGNQVGNYQYYIHGSGSVNKYIELSDKYKNPNDTVSKQGAKFTLDSTAFWNGQTMRRIELIPQTKAAIASGKVFYHFSIMRTDKNAPSVNREHQICFFESHFTGRLAKHRPSPLGHPEVWILIALQSSSTAGSAARAALRTQICNS